MEELKQHIYGRAIATDTLRGYNYIQTPWGAITTDIWRGYNNRDMQGLYPQIHWGTITTDNNKTLKRYLEMMCMTFLMRFSMIDRQMKKQRSCKYRYIHAYGLYYR